MGERGGKGNAGRRRGVVLVGALIFKPPERSCVGQDTFVPCLKCKLLEGRQGLLQTPKSIEEEPWMPRGSGSSLGGCEAGSVPASLERRQMPFRFEPQSSIRRTCMEKFIPVSGKGKKNICSHHQSGNLSQ